MGLPPFTAIELAIAAFTFASVPSAVSPAIHSATMRAPARAAKSALFCEDRRWTRA